MHSKKLACYFDNNALKFFYIHNLADALNRYKTLAKEHKELHSSTPH